MPDKPIIPERSAQDEIDDMRRRHAAKFADKPAEAKQPEPDQSHGQDSTESTP